MPSILILLRRLCVDVSGDETLAGLCGAVALMVQAAVGGELMEGSYQGEPHYWNRLPCGTEIDLTGTQFGGDGVHPVTSGELVGMPEYVDPMHLAFAYHVLMRLEAEQSLKGTK